MRGAVFVFIAAIMVGVQAGCEWYRNCGACVADSGCGWCGNDPSGVGSGTISSTVNSDGKEIAGVRSTDFSITGAEGSRVVNVGQRVSDLHGGRSDSKSDNGLVNGWLINVAGQYEKVANTASMKAVVENTFTFEGTGYVTSPYFGQTWGGTDRKKGLIGVHKTKFTTELKASYTVTPYTMGTYTVSSVQSDTQATLTGTWASTFSNIEYQIGNIPCSGSISFPDTSKQDVYGSWPPNPTKFTTELKDGYTIKCSTGSVCTGTNVRIKTVYNDQHVQVDPRFTTSFADQSFAIEMGARGVGLISGTTGNVALQGSDPCKTQASPAEACYENTRFLTELRSNDRIEINSNLTGTVQVKTVASIEDDAHLTLTTTLGSMINTKSKFKIKSFHSAPYTYARKATGGLSYSGGTSKQVTGYNSTTFTKNLMSGYTIVAKVPGVGYESRVVVSIDSSTKLTVDQPFSASFGVGHEAGTPSTDYNYESCPSLTYENFDMRTENGHGVISSDGTNHVYDNVQYAKVTTLATTNTQAKAAFFVRHLKVGFTVMMDGITRTVTKVVSNTLIHVDRAFKEGVQYTEYSYRYSVRKTGDFHMHWKPATTWGDYNNADHAKDSQIFSRQTIATTAGGVSFNKQDKYLLYPPVCYNTGRCVAKTSHSLVGVESAQHDIQVLSSALSHQTPVKDYVFVSGAGYTANSYFANCKPVCTITVADTATPSANAIWETRRAIRNVNSTFFQTELPFEKVPLSTGSNMFKGRVRYVTGTGTVKVESGFVVTGASKETKTKFNSEQASSWTITLGCGGAVCKSTACTADSDCLIAGKVTGGKCTGTAPNKICTAETKNVTAVSSDTKLTTSQAFANTYTKVDYTIGNIPGLGYVTSSQSSKIVDGNANTRFLEQLKVGYTITSMTQVRTIAQITSNQLMTIDTPFQTPGITTPTSYLFSGKKGTGEVTVSGAAPKEVLGTKDVTQTQFQHELALGYMFMIGNDYKVVTKITSNTILEVDTAFNKVAATAYGSAANWGNDYNYESCWLSAGAEAGVVGTGQAGGDVTDPTISHESNGASPPVYSQTGSVNSASAYTNKKVYVEDACEIKPGCCGFKISSVVYPDRFAYYKIRPAHTNLNIRVVVKTTEDNVDLVVKKSAVPTTASYDYKSVRESNPWALTVPQAAITCPAWAGHANTYVPNNCDYWYIGVRGDNRYPQKTGASEYDLFVYTEFDWPNFLCSDAEAGQGTDKCKWLGLSKVEDTNFVTNDDSQAAMRLTPNTNMAKGASFYSTKVHVYDGFETQFQFRMTGFSVGCNSVLYPSGFCGGGDGFAFVIQKETDMKIGCAGAGLGYGKVLASKQGNDWSRHRCVSVSGDATLACDVNDNGVFDGQCVAGALCKVDNPANGGCGTTGSCGFQDCVSTNAITQALAVEFDTWNNLKLHDPKQGVSRWWINATEFVGYNDNHVAIFAAEGTMQTDHALNEHFAATPSIPNLADGQNHTVKIKYWPMLFSRMGIADGVYNRTNLKTRGAIHTNNVQTCGDCEDTNTPTKYPAPDDCYRCKIRNSAPGNFAIFIDDMKRPVLQTSISLRKSPVGESGTCHDSDRDRCVLDSTGNAYIGFTAGTGGERAGGRTVTGDHVKVGSEAAVSANSASAVAESYKMLGAAQNHEILNWKFCNMIGCVAI